MIGLLLIAAALFLTIYNFMDDNRASRSAHGVMDQLREMRPEKESEEDDAASQSAAGEVEVPDYVLNPKMKMPVKVIDGQEYIAVLKIPAFGLELPVLSQWSYPNLRIAPCRYQGSAYTDDLVIAAHNYTSHFGNLKNLQEGDTVILTDMDDNVFTYKVALRETLMPTAVEEMSSGDWDLTLFTCTLGGSYRVTVRCERVRE